MQVEHEAHNRTFQSCAQSLINGKSSAGDLRGSFKVQNIQIRTDVPVCFWFEVKLGRFFKFADLNVRAVVLADLHEVRRHVRDVQEGILNLRVQLRNLCIEHLDFVGQFPHLRHDRGGILPRLFQLWNFLGYGVLLVFHRFHFRQNRASFFVQCRNLLDAEAALGSSLYAGLDAFVVFSDSFDV